MRESAAKKEGRRLTSLRTRASSIKAEALQTASRSSGTRIVTRSRFPRDQRVDSNWTTDTRANTFAPIIIPVLMGSLSFQHATPSPLIRHQPLRSRQPRPLNRPCIALPLLCEIENVFRLLQSRRHSEWHAKLTLESTRSLVSRPSRPRDGSTARLL